MTAYKSALDHLPPCPKKPPSTAVPLETGIAEVTDDEAAAINEETSRQEAVDPAVREKEEVEEEIRDCTKACWGNLGACYISLVGL